MRDNVIEFVKICADVLPMPEPIYEFGSLQVPGQEGYSDLRVHFPGRKYVGADMREGPGVDTLLDLHAISLPGSTVGSVLLMDTLEHVEYPHRALGEIERILAPGGIVILSSVMDFPIHDYPHDYWRFTPEGVRSLLRAFPCSFVQWAGPQELPHTVVGVGVKGHLPRALAARLEDGFLTWRSRQVPSGVKRAARWMLPPAIFDLYHWALAGRRPRGAPGP